MRGRRIACLVIAVLMTVVAGCGDDEGGTTSAASGSSEKVTLTFWNGFSDADRPAVEELVRRFNESQSKVQIDMTITKWDVMFQKLLPAYSAGKGPDIVAMDTQQFPGYASKGVFAELGDLYDSGAIPADELVDTAPAASMYDGKQYGVPMSFGTTLLYWNKKLFKEAGLDPDRPPADWDEWAEYARKLTKDENGDGKPEQYGVVFPETAAPNVWALLLWGTGGGVVSEDGKTATLGDPASIEAVDYWSKLVLEDHISPIGLTGVDMDKLVQSGKAAMMVNGPWAGGGLEQAKVDYGLGDVPAGPAGPATLGISIAMSLNAKADDAKKQAAAEFFSFWNSAESQTYWSLNSGFPPTRKDVDPADLAENPNIQKFAASADQAKFYLAGVPRYAEVNDNVFIPTIQKILNKRGTPQELLPQAAEEITPLLGAG